MNAPVRANSRSSSGSTPGRSHSRTPERGVPARPAIAQLVPDLSKCVKVTSNDDLDAHAIKRAFQYAGVFPEEIKLVNSKMAFAIFDSKLSAGRLDYQFGTQNQGAACQRIESITS